MRTSEIILEAVEFNADGIGAVQESDDLIDVGAGSGYDSSAAAATAGCGGITRLPGPSLQRSR